MASGTTLADIARQAGVAISTASRAFNQPELLKPETVTRVRRIAEEMGYVANRYARALSTGRTGFVGLILPDVVNPFFPPLIRAAQRTADQFNRSLLVVETNSIQDAERHQIASLTPECEGLIIASSRLPAQELRQVADRGKVILINNDTSGVARVLLSSAEPLRQAIAVLHTRGHRSFAYLGGPYRSWSEAERLGALMAQADELKLTTHVFRVESGTYQQARGFTDRVLATEPDCIIAFDDVIAHGILDGLLHKGVSVPEEIALVGCDDALPIQTHPRISTITLPTRTAVEHAVTALIECPTETVPEMRIVFSGDLKLRETT